MVDLVGFEPTTSSMPFPEVRKAATSRNGHQRASMPHLSWLFGPYVGAGVIREEHDFPWLAKKGYDTNDGTLSSCPWQLFDV